MEYKFRVWIDGNYYYDDEEYDVEIGLTEKEYATIKSLVDEYGFSLSHGLMPILKGGPEELYHKFYAAIFPHVFFEFFSRDEMFEPVPGDEDKVWHEEDFDYLIKTYGDNYYLDESYKVFIPDEMMPPEMRLFKDISKDALLLYIRKWNIRREGLFDWIVAYHGYPHGMESSLYDIIETRLLEIAQETIKNTDERTLAEDDFDPFSDLDEWDEGTKLYEEFKKTLRH